MHSKRYRAWSPYQSYLLPPSPQEWLPRDHLIYFLLDVVQELDLDDIERVIRQKDPRGERPYSPQMMVALLLYAYCVGVYSSRKIAQATYEDVAFRVLCGDTHPFFTTVNQFRLDHHRALAGRFVEILQLCQRAGLVRLGHVAFDGSKVQANASKHKAMSYERMNKEEARLRAEIDEMLARADAADREEDARYGKGQEAPGIPAELLRRETRLARIRALRAELEKEAAQARAEALHKLAQAQRDKAEDPCVAPAERQRAATRAKKSVTNALELFTDDDDDPPSSPSDGADDLPHHRVPTQADGTPAPTAQRNFTDADSRIMKNNTGFLQGYNAQIAVDDLSQVIVAQAVTNQAPDQEHLEPMVRRTIQNCGQPPAVITADTGYFSQHNVHTCQDAGVDPYIAVGRQKHGDTPTMDLAQPGTASQIAKQRMREKLQLPAGHAIYARRKATAEPPFGQIKEVRRFRRFSLRGLAKVRSEWALICLTHNLLKLFRSIRSAKSTAYPVPLPAPA